MLPADFRSSSRTAHTLCERGALSLRRLVCPPQLMHGGAMWDQCDESRQSRTVVPGRAAALALAFSVRGFGVPGGLDLVFLGDVPAVYGRHRPGLGRLEFDCVGLCDDVAGGGRAGIDVGQGHEPRRR